MHWRAQRIVTGDSWLLRQIVGTLKARGYSRGVVGRGSSHYAVTRSATTPGKAEVRWWEPEPTDSEDRRAMSCREQR